MATQRIDPQEWGNFFNAIAKALVGKQAEIEVASLDLGDQILAEWLPLIGISYDPRNDLIEVAMEEVGHMIRSPREVHVTQDAGGIVALQIADGAGNRQIVKLREPLALPRQ